jgi:hypothetical protein
MKRQSFSAVVVAAVVGTVLAFFGIRWIVTGHIEYWTGPTERHHVFASPDSSPTINWVLVFVFCAGAIALWARSITEVFRRIRSRSDGGIHAA